MANKSTKNSASIPEWLPDWRDPKKYPNHENTTPQQWAWQFLRRNSEYQLLWHQLIAPFYNFETGEFDSGKAMQTARETHIQSAGKKTDYCIKNPAMIIEEKFGIKGFLPPPSMNNGTLIFKHQAIGFQSRFINEPTPHKLGGSLVDYSEIVIHFDLRFPIKTQIQRAENLLKNRKLYLKENGILEKKETRKRVENYHNYLRILDAVRNREKTKTIAEIIYPKILNKHPDYNAEQFVRDDLKAAKLMCEKGYAFLF